MSVVRLDRPVPTRYQDDILKNLHWIDAGVHGLEFDPDDERVLRYRYEGGAPEDVGRRLKEIAGRLARSLEILPNRVIFESSARDVPGCRRPYEALCERGWVRPVGQGCHVYGGLMSDLYHALEERFRRDALALDVSEWKFPTLMSVETLARTGFLQGFPHNVDFVSHLPEQMEAVEQFKAGLNRQGLAALGSGAAELTPPAYVLAPTVCHHFYEAHEGQVVAGGVLGATALSPCYRYEGKSLGGLRRLHEFNMREIMFVGTADQVRARRDALLDLAKRTLEVLEIQSVIQTASDPFFLDTYDRQRIFQMSFDLKYEVQAYLPDDKAWLAIGSVNYHQDHFGKAFGIRLESGEAAHSCCLGFGLDRWCMAVFAQYGLDPAGWPKALRGLVTSYQGRTAARGAE